MFYLWTFIRMMFYLDECSSFLWNKHFPALLDRLFHKCPLNSWLMVSFSSFISLIISYLFLFTTKKKSSEVYHLIVDLLIFSVLSFPFSWQILIHIFWGLLLVHAHLGLLSLPGEVTLLSFWKVLLYPS